MKKFFTFVKDYVKNVYESCPWVFLIVFGRAFGFMEGYGLWENENIGLRWKIFMIILLTLGMWGLLLVLKIIFDTCAYGVSLLRKGSKRKG